MRLPYNLHTSIHRVLQQDWACYKFSDLMENFQQKLKNVFRRGLFLGASHYLVFILNKTIFAVIINMLSLKLVQ